MIPKFTDLPTFSDDPEQNAEMRAEYLADCRMMGVDPYREEIEDEYNDEYDYPDDDDDDE